MSACTYPYIYMEVDLVDLSTWPPMVASEEMEVALVDVSTWPSRQVSSSLISLIYRVDQVDKSTSLI